MFLCATTKSGNTLKEKRLNRTELVYCTACMCPRSESHYLRGVTSIHISAEFYVTLFTGFGIPEETRCLCFCAGLVCAGTGFTTCRGRGKGIYKSLRVTRFSFVRERDFTYITATRDNPESSPKPRDKSRWKKKKRGRPCRF